MGWGGGRGVAGRGRGVDGKLSELRAGRVGRGERWGEIQVKLIWRWGEVRGGVRVGRGESWMGEWGGVRGRGEVGDEGWARSEPVWATCRYSMLVDVSCEDV